jgi:hypothetical protein
MSEPDPAAVVRTMVRRLIAVAIVLVILGALAYGALALLSPARWVHSVTNFAEMLWDRLPHVPLLGPARREVPAAIRRTEEAQAALREQAAAVNAALAQAAGARAQVAALKAELARSQAALGPMLRQQSELAALNVRHVERVRELEDALAKVKAQPVAPVTTRQQAVEALRRLGY